MIIIDIFVFMLMVSIALAFLYMTCISIAFIIHKFCNMILFVAQTSARGIISMFVPKMVKKSHYGCYNGLITE